MLLRILKLNNVYNCNQQLDFNEVIVDEGEAMNQLLSSHRNRERVINLVESEIKHEIFKKKFNRFLSNSLKRNL